MLFKIDVFFVLLKKLLLNQSTSKNLFVDVPNVAYENQSFIREKRTVKEVVSSCLNINCVKSAQILSFFWSVFSHIRTEYGEILRISPYLVRMQENVVQKKLRIWTLFTQWLVLQLQIELNESWKVCLSLWSWRLLKPNRNLLSNFISLGL